MRAPSSHERAPAFVIWFLIADVLLTVGYLLDWWAGGRSAKLTALLDLDGDANLVAWYLSMQLFLLAFFLAIFAGRYVEKHAKTSWLLLIWPLIFAVWSFEEITGVRKWLIFKLDRRFPFGLPGSHEAAATGLIFVGLLVLGSAYWLRRYVSARVARRYLLGILLLIAPAATVHVVGGAISSSAGLRVLGVCAVRLGELLGVTIVLWATYELLAAHDLSVMRPAPDGRPA